jgi:hypothetical protein
MCNLDEDKFIIISLKYNWKLSVVKFKKTNEYAGFIFFYCVSTIMGEGGRLKAAMQMSGQTATAPALSKHKPEPEERSKRKNVLIIESDKQMMLLVEEPLKRTCNLPAYKTVAGLKEAMELVDAEVDVVVIGLLFQDGEGLCREIKMEHPEIKVIKLAGTGESERITAEMLESGKKSIYDQVVRWSRLNELGGIIKRGLD